MILLMHYIHTFIKRYSTILITKYKTSLVEWLYQGSLFIHDTFSKNMMGTDVVKLDLTRY